MGFKTLALLVVAPRHDEVNKSPVIYKVADCQGLSVSDEYHAVFHT